MRKLATTLGVTAALYGLTWTGSVARAPARVKWLRWALAWDLEAQGSDA